MFYPQEMAEIEIVVPERDVLAVTSALAREGIFHQIDTSYLNSKSEVGGAGDWRDQATACASLERRIQSLMKTLDIEEGQPPAMDSDATAEIEVSCPTADFLERETRDMIDVLSTERQELEQLESYIRQLEPIADIGIDIGTLSSSRYVVAIPGIMPSDNIGRLETSLTRIPYTLLTLRQEAREAVVMLLGTKGNADVLERAARSAYLNPLDLPGSYQGTPREIIASLNAQVKEAQEHIAEQRALMTELREAYKTQLRDLLWQARTSRILSDAMARFGKLRYTYVIVGWVPVAGLDDLRARLRRLSEEILIEASPSKRRVPRQDVPVSLKNPGILGSFQQLVTTYARPRYQEIDPTLLITLTFPLLFGAMFGDVGQGLVLALFGGLLASRKVKALRGWRDLGVVITVCGLIAALFGFLYGSVFGVESVLPALWIRPMENILQILLVAIGAGVLILTVGFFLGIVNAFMAREWGHLLFGAHGISGLVLFWSFVAMAATFLLPRSPIPIQALLPLAVVSGLLVMFSEPLGRAVEGRRPLLEVGLAAYAIQTVFELFETLLSLFSNTLSYVRVGAFAVAHGGLSTAVFILADMVGSEHSPGYWAVVVLGNVFIVGFEGMIVGIQTLRLEYYEFFSKFFSGGGSSYAPLKIPSAASD